MIAWIFFEQLGLLSIPLLEGPVQELPGGVSGLGFAGVEHPLDCFPEHLLAAVHSWRICCALS